MPIGQLSAAIIGFWAYGGKTAEHGQCRMRRGWHNLDRPSQTIISGLFLLNEYEGIGRREPHRLEPVIGRDVAKGSSLLLCSGGRAFLGRQITQGTFN